MISYQHGVKQEVLKLRQRLKQEGFNVWIDVENMSGSTLESMASAVENSIAVIPVLTEKYKESNACRQGRILLEYFFCKCKSTQA